MGVEHSTLHLWGLVYTVLYMARVISQHTLLDEAESPGQFVHFFALLPQELKDVLPSLSSWRSTLCLHTRPKSYPSSLRPNLRLAVPRIYGLTGLTRSNTGSDTCVQYVLPDQGPEVAGSWSRMTHHLGRARLTSASPPRGPWKTPLGYDALQVGCHTEKIVWTVLGHRLPRFCSVPQEIHSFSSLISRRHLQTHSQRHCLGHTSFSMHADRRVYSVPCFRPGIDPFIGYPSRTGKMPVYRAPSAKPPHPSFFGIAKRRTSSRYQFQGKVLCRS